MLLCNLKDHSNSNELEHLLFTKFNTTLFLWSILVDLNNAFIYQQESSLFKYKIQIPSLNP